MEHLRKHFFKLSTNFQRKPTDFRTLNIIIDRNVGLCWEYSFTFVISAYEYDSPAEADQTHARSGFCECTGNNYTKRANY